MFAAQMMNAEKRRMELEAAMASAGDSPAKNSIEQEDFDYLDTPDVDDDGDGDSDDDADDDESQVVTC